MFTILTQASNAVQFILNSVVVAAESATFAGYYLSSLLLIVLTSFYAFAANLGRGLIIILEDFHLFMSESFEWTSETLTLLGETMVAFLVVAGSIPGRLFSSLVSLVPFFKNVVPVLLSQFVILAFDAVLLIGLCVYNVLCFILSCLVYLNEMPHVALLLLAKQLDVWIAGSSDWANSQFVRATLGLAFIYSIRLASVRYGILETILEISSDCSVVFMRYLRRTVRFLLRGVIVTFVKTCELLIRTGLFIRGQFKRRSSRRDETDETRAEYKEKLCLVCWDRPLEIVFLNCRHLCLCGPCADIVARDSGACPICRKPISSLMKIYS